MDAAHDPRVWHDFYLMSGGASAALTGLIFVAVTIHMHRVTHNPILRAGCVTTLASMGVVILFSAAALTPGQSNGAIGYEVLAAIIGLFFFSTVVLQRARKAHGEVPRMFWTRLPAGLMAFGFAIEGGITLIAGGPGGFYAIDAATLIGIGTSIQNAWFLVATAEVKTRKDSAEEDAALTGGALAGEPARGGN